MKYLLSMTACLAIIAVAAPASAATISDQTIAALTAAPQNGSPTSELQMARGGADDPAGHVRGHDDGAKHKGGGGADDGPNHA